MSRSLLPGTRFVGYPAQHSREQADAPGNITYCMETHCAAASALRYCAPEQYIMSKQTPQAPSPPVAAILSPALWQVSDWPSVLLAASVATSSLMRFSLRASFCYGGGWREPRPEQTMRWKTQLVFHGRAYAHHRGVFSVCLVVSS